jgi:energy-coupling factor transporter transmembrane protein EcfT
MYVFPTADAFAPQEVVLAGFKQCVYGTIAFAVGSIVVAPKISPDLRSATHQATGGERGQVSSMQSQRQTSAAYQRRIAWGFLGLGVVSYLLSSTLIGRLPSIGAVVSQGQYLVVVGLCLLVWIAWLQRNRLRIWLLLSTTLLFPLVTMITRGFMGYGVVALLMVFAFTATFYRPRWHMVVTGVAAVYLGLTIFVGYKAQRTELRAAVWGEKDLGARWEQIEDIATDTKWFNPSNPVHIADIVGRLNLSYHVGVATEYVGHKQEFAQGETVWQAMIAVIPRVLWPSKPSVAGSQDIVSTYTGFEFAPGTSVGVGHVLEWYINFGTWGVILGFLLFGTIVTIIDIRASVYLERGNFQRFALWFLPGLSFLNVGGQFAALTSSLVAGILAVWGINTFVVPILLEDLSPRRSFPGTSRSGTSSLSRS